MVQRNIWLVCDHQTGTQRSMWPVCDHQTEHRRFNLARAFTSQGDLFVFCAKSPVRGDSCFHFSFQVEVYPLKQLESPSPTSCPVYTQERNL